MDVISTPVTPKPADSQRQEEMGRSLPFTLSLGLSPMLLLLAQLWAGASMVMGVLCKERWVCKCWCCKTALT